MTVTATALPPLIADYVGLMHYIAIGLGLAVPFLRWLASRLGGHHYSVRHATHDGFAAGALPSLGAMVLSIGHPTIISNVAPAEFFAAGLLGIFSTLAQLCTFKEAGSNSQPASSRH